MRMGSPLLHVSRHADIAKLTGAFYKLFAANAHTKIWQPYLRHQGSSPTLECLLSLFYCTHGIKHFTQTHAHLLEPYFETFTSKCYLKFIRPM
jgi:hypothetical protein